MTIVSCIIFYGSLLLSITFGSHYKNVVGADMKRDVGVGFGLILAVLICGHYIYYSLVMVWVNIIIIKCCNQRYMHQLSFAYTWIYMLYLHYSVRNVYIIWLHQVQALKLVGLASEIYKNSVNSDGFVKFRVEDNDNNASIQPTSVEIAAYCYCFIGLLKGPYFSWKTYADHLKDQFIVAEDCWTVTEVKLKNACVCGVIYFFLRSKYSTEIYENPIFYQKYGADFRFLYNIPLSIMYILHYEVLALLSTSVCTVTGLGVYPSKSKHTPGNVASTEATRETDVPEDQFNLECLQCFSNKKIFLGPTMRDTISSWDMPTRDWFSSHVYRGLLRSNKEIRSVLSFLAWAVWCGPTIPTLIVATTLWVYVELEAEYITLYNTTGSMAVPWDIGFSIMRLFCLLYLTPCFMVSDTSTVLKYYNSIFWVYHFILLVLTIIVLINKFKRS